MSRTQIAAELTERPSAKWPRTPRSWPNLLQRSKRRMIPQLARTAAHTESRILEWDFLRRPLAAPQTYG